MSDGVAFVLLDEVCHCLCHLLTVLGPSGSWSILDVVRVLELEYPMLDSLSAHCVTSVHLQQSIVNVFGRQTLFDHEFDQNLLLLLVWWHASVARFVNSLRFSEQPSQRSLYQCTEIAQIVGSQHTQGQHDQVGDQAILRKNVHRNQNASFICRILWANLVTNATINSHHRRKTY